MEYLEFMGMLYGARSGGWHIIIEHMALEKWLEMAWSMSTWQVCFRRTPELMSSLCQRAVVLGYLPPTRGGHARLPCTRYGGHVSKAGSLLTMLNWQVRWLCAELVGKVVSHIGSTWMRSFLYVSMPYSTCQIEKKDLEIKGGRRKGFLLL